MGTFTKSILERERYTRQQEKLAEKVLNNTNKTDFDYKNNLETVCNAIKYILEIFNIKIFEYFKWDIFHKSL